MAVTLTRRFPSAAGLVERGRARRASLRLLYRRLLRTLGPQGWWPAQGPYEMMVGAILTQATNWHNVEQAIDRLKARGPLTARRILASQLRHVQRAIRPAGYFRQKAARLQAFTRWYVNRYGGQAARMFRIPWPALREELLALHGIGPETADSMLLYAGGQPVFVVDAYTTRIFRRHRLIRANATYGQVQRLVMNGFPAPASVYNEFHALLVATGKRFCHRRQPDCEHCPLGALPHTVR